MTDTRDPRGIGSFFIRYLVLHAVFLLGFTLSYVVEIALIYFFGFIGFFTFLQVPAQDCRVRVYVVVGGSACDSGGGHWIVLDAQLLCKRVEFLEQFRRRVAGSCLVLPFLKVGERPFPGKLRDDAEFPYETAEENALTVQVRLDFPTYLR